MNIPLEKYSSLHLEDWLLDDYFINSHKNPTEQSTFFWKQVIQSYPEQEETMEKAKLVLDRMVGSQKKPTAEVQQRIWTTLEKASKEAELAEAPVIGKQQQHPVSIGWKPWIKLGAAAILLMGAFSIYKVINQPKEIQTTLTTAFGEHKEITLPDNSKVTLNGNSSIKFSNTWGKNNPREVWIKGEAFLDVKHVAKNSGATTEGERFLVHLEQLDVEVLGTRFNVKSRSQGEEIELQHGSVQVVSKGSKDILRMVPGDVVKFEREQNKLEKFRKEASLVDDWIENKIHFDNTPLTEVMGMLEETYGLDVELKNDALKNRTISGDITAENEEVLLTALQIMMNVQVKKTGNKVIIQ